MKVFVLIIFIILVIAILILLLSPKKNSIIEGFKHIHGIENMVKPPKPEFKPSVETKRENHNTIPFVPQNKDINIEKRFGVKTNARNVAAIFDDDVDETYENEFGMSKSAMMALAVERKNAMNHNEQEMPRNPNINLQRLQRVQANTYQGLLQQAVTNPKEDFMINFYRNMPVILADDTKEYERKNIDPPITQNEYLKRMKNVELSIKNGILQ